MFSGRALTVSVISKLIWLPRPLPSEKSTSSAARLMSRAFVANGKCANAIQNHTAFRVRGKAVEQIVGRERRGRLSQLAWCGGRCFDSRRRVDSTVGRGQRVTRQDRVKMSR